MKIFSFLVVILIANFVSAEPVPKEHMSIINKALDKAFGISQPDSIEVLSGGFSSPGMYKVVAKGKTYVVRLSNHERSLADRTRELDAMQKSAKRGVAPKVFYSNIEDGIIIMEWIENQRPHREELLQDKNLKTLAKQIRKIHDGPEFGEFYTPFQIARHFESTLQGVKPQIAIDALKLLQDLEEKLKRRLVRKPCHNDLNPNNIMYSHGKVIFIDWEAASQSDPYFDLGSILVFYDLNDHQTSLFLKDYFGHKPKKAELSKLHDMQRVSMLYYGFTLLMTIQKMKQEFLDPKTIESLPRLSELYKKKGKDLLKTPRDLQEYGLILLREALLLSH